MTNSTYTRKTRSGETLTIGLCADMDIDNDGEPEYKYATFCEDHGVFVLSKTRDLAYRTSGVDFCDDCRARAAAPKVPAEKAVKVDFSKRTQAAAYKLGAMEAYSLLVTMLEEGGINNLLEGIELNADSATVARMDAYYGARKAEHEMGR